MSWQVSSNNNFLQDKAGDVIKIIEGILVDFLNFAFVKAEHCHVMHITKGIAFNLLNEGFSKGETLNVETLKCAGFYDVNICTFDVQLHQIFELIEVTHW